MTDIVKFRLDISKASLSAERSAVEGSDDCELGEETKTQRPGEQGISTSHFVEPVTLIGAVTLAWLAKRLTNHWLKDKEQGVQIDLREKPPAISRISGVPMGFLVIINEDGRAEVHKGEYDKPEDLMPLLKSIVAPA